MCEKICKEEKEIKCTKDFQPVNFVTADYVPLFISSTISMIACLPLDEFESKLLTVMSSNVPCRKGIPIILIIADCSNRVLMKYITMFIILI